MVRIEIEQHEANRWAGFVETGGMDARRASVRGESIEEVVDAVYEAYRRFVPLDPEAPPKIETVEIDHDLEPVIPKPVGPEEVQRMRDEADGKPARARRQRRAGV